MESELQIKVNDNFENSSFRDPEGRVFIDNFQVFRTLSNNAYRRMDQLFKLDFFQDLLQAGKIVDTQIIQKNNQKLLQHEYIPFISFHYEWSFSMLKDASLLVLELLEILIQNDYILKDGTAFNVVFEKGKFKFIDLLSIDCLNKGQPWYGYVQFCQEFLYPLMLKSYSNLNTNIVGLSRLSGWTGKEMASILSLKNIFKKGYFKYIWLQSKLESSSIKNNNIISKFNETNFPKKSLIKLVNDLKLTVKSLTNKNSKSVWVNYKRDNSYNIFSKNRKNVVIERYLKTVFPSSDKKIVDLGCNTGEYSLLAAEYGKVISIDSCSECVDELYLHCKKNNIMNITPLVVNLLEPTPSRGWSLQERKDLFSRLGSRNFFMALALIHHICIANNVPLNMFVKNLYENFEEGIIEWVSKDDQMVKVLLVNRKDVFIDYTYEKFISTLECYFKIKDIEELSSTRKLLLVQKNY